MPSETFEMKNESTLEEKKGKLAELKEELERSISELTETLKTSSPTDFMVSEMQKKVAQISEEVEDLEQEINATSSPEVETAKRIVENRWGADKKDYFQDEDERTKPLLAGIEAEIAEKTERMKRFDKDGREYQNLKADLDILNRKAGHLREGLEKNKERGAKLAKAA